MKGFVLQPSDRRGSSTDRTPHQRAPLGCLAPRAELRCALESLPALLRPIRGGVRGLCVVGDTVRSGGM